MQEIKRCNEELSRLENNPDEAKQEVNYEPAYRYGKITYKNKIQFQRDTYIDQLSGYLERYNLGIRSNAYSQGADFGEPKYLAFIDILGFSNIVKSSTFQELQSLVGLLSYDIQMNLVSDQVGRPKTRWYRYGLAFDLDETTINSILLSDTIIFWTQNDSIESFFELVKAVQIFMHFEACFTNIALRGAITVGRFSYNDLRISHPQLVVDQSTIYGEAIVDAHEWEKKQEWMGCVVTKEAVNRFLEQAPSQSMQDDVFNKYLIKYQVPIKEQNSSLPIEDYVIKWPRDWESENGPKMIEKCFIRYQKLDAIPDRPDIQRKHKNTVEFAEYVIKISADKTAP